MTEVGRRGFLYACVAGVAGAFAAVLMDEECVPLEPPDTPPGLPTVQYWDGQEWHVTVWSTENNWTSWTSG